MGRVYNFIGKDWVRGRVPRGGSYPEGKCGNIFYRGNVIYSYGRHYPIAKYFDCELNGKRERVVLFNENGYSTSTKSHRSAIRNSIPSNWVLIEVNDPEMRLDEDRFDEYFAEWDKKIGHVADLVKKAKRARKYGSIVLDDAHHKLTNVNRFVALTGLSVPVTDNPEEAESILGFVLKAVESAPLKANPVVPL